MPVVAIEGYLGSGYQTIGRSVAEKLGIDFVDRVILSEIAKEMDKHLAEIVEPALAEGRDVITDRSYGSTLAYQGYGRGQSIEELMRLVEWTSGGLLPYLVVLLTVAVDTADDRLGDQRDRMESEDSDFATRVIEGFTALAEADPDRWVVVDGAGSIEEVAARVAKAVGLP